MASDERRRLYDALLKAEDEWRECKQAGAAAGSRPTPDGSPASAWPEAPGRDDYRRRERELFARLETARKAWLDSWAPATTTHERDAAS